ncbi:MAG: hypothetical protein OEN20_01980, partial [Gammaproteobacteria bacterium]|nr:hypothetical protein [Gammaproteobacteria bacterium]
LQELLDSCTVSDLPDAASQRLVAIGARVKRLRARVAAGRDEVAENLSAIRRRRHAAAAYRRHG